MSTCTDVFGTAFRTFYKLLSIFRFGCASPIVSGINCLFLFVSLSISESLLPSAATSSSSVDSPLSLSTTHITWCSAVVPSRRPLLRGRHRGSTSSTFSVVIISGRAPYAAVDVRRPNFPGRRLSSLEWSATPRHVCTVTACVPQSSEDSSLQTQFPLTVLLCPRSDTSHRGHNNRCFYLLTY